MSVLDKVPDKTTLSKMIVCPHPIQVWKVCPHPTPGVGYGQIGHKGFKKNSFEGKGVVMCVLDKVLVKATLNKMIICRTPTHGCWAWVGSKGIFFF